MGNQMSAAAGTLDAERERVRRHEQLLEGENEVLKLIVDRAPLPAVLEALTDVAERQSKGGLLASILLLDPDGRTLRHGAAPSLPPAYSQAIDGSTIGPKVGSCGTAAFRGTPVIVSDIATDPLWEDFRDLALQHGLRACWSTPILSARRTVLGTFALYYRTACIPGIEDEAIVQILARTAALAIEHYRAENELAESEERFRSLGRCAPVGVFMTDSAGTFQYVNPRFIDIGAFEYEKTLEYWLESATGTAVEPWREAIQMRAEYSAQFKVTRNTPREVSLRMAPLRSRSGVYLGYVGTLEDVSAQVASAAALQTESSLRRAIEESVPSGIAVISTDRIQTYVNPAFARMVGWHTDELIGASAPFVYWPEDEMPAIEQALAAAMEHAAPAEGFELKFRRKSGEVFDALVTIAPLRDHDKTVSGWVASVSDITARKRAEEALGRSEARLAMALEAGRMGAWEWDVRTGAVSWSPQLEQIHGLPPGSFGGTFEDFQTDMLAEHKPRVLAAIQEALDRKSTYRVAYELVRPDGTTAWVEARGRVLCDASGNPEKMIGVCMELSEARGEVGTGSTA